VIPQRNHIRTGFEYQIRLFRRYSDHIRVFSVYYTEINVLRFPEFLQVIIQESQTGLAANISNCQNFHNSLPTSY
jgi:hypothetical protein